MIRGRTKVLGIVMAMLGGLSLVTAAPVSAAPVPIAPDAGLWQADGRVDAVTYSTDGGTLYLAGTFHHLCPPGQKTCNGTESADIAIDYLAALNSATGAPLTSWRPQPDAEVQSLALSSTGTLYVGGIFNKVSGQTHHKLAAITASTGLAIASWKPAVSAEVKAVALSPDGLSVYVGGAFLTVDLLPRPLLAALSTYSVTTPAAVLQTWAPTPSGSDTIDKGVLIPTTVNTIVVRPGDGQVYVAGVFTTIGGLDRSNVAALAPATGSGLGVAVTEFSLNPPLHYVSLNVTLTRDGSTVFINGRGPGGFVLAADSTSGTRFWSRRLDGDVQAAVATDTLLYVGGHFDLISITGTTLKDERHHLAAFDTATGKTDPWNPRANSAFGINGLAWSPGHIAAGGDFTQIEFRAHSALAQFSGGDLIPPAAVTTLTTSSTAKGRVDLAWSAVPDADSVALSYRIYRRPLGGSFALVGSVAGPSAATATSGMTFADSTGTFGSSYEYQVRAADPVFLGTAGNVSGPIVVAGDQSAPNSPTNVAVISPSPGNALVTWDGAGDGDDDTLTYTVTRHNGALTTDVGVLSGPALGESSWVDSSRNGGSFTYTVRAGDGTFTSAPSAATSLVAVPGDTNTPKIPTAVVVVSPSPNRVDLTWTASTDTDQSAAQISYVVSRKSAGASGSGLVIARTAPGQTAYTETSDGVQNPLPGRSYTYYVAATDGPNISLKTTGKTVAVQSSVFADDLTTMAAWTLPIVNSGVTQDATRGNSAAPSARLVGQSTPVLNGYSNRAFGAGYRTACVKEWLSLGAFDTSTNGQTTLMRMFSTAGNDIARLYVDGKGRLWIRGDWGSSPNLTSAVLVADSSWHSVQLCVTTTANAVDGSLTAWFDATKFGPIVGVDNSPDLLASVDIGDRVALNFTMNIDDVSAGTTAR